jgi:hypothetical protein
LAQDFPFSFEPVVEITTILTAPRFVPFERALRNQNIEIVQGQTRGFSHVCVIRTDVWFFCATKTSLSMRQKFPFVNDPLRSRLKEMSMFKE